MNKEKIPTSIYLDDDVREAIEQLAKEDERSLSFILQPGTARTCCQKEEAEEVDNQRDGARDSIAKQIPNS